MKVLLAHLVCEFLANAAARSEQLVDESHVRAADFLALLQKHLGEFSLYLGIAEKEKSSEYYADTRKNSHRLLECQTMNINFHRHTS